jgi:CubicO group peptidase (beta-lactamase class C family)
MTADDKLLMGSGTKPFTAVAILKLVDQGKVNLEDPAMLHIDPPLKYMYNTTMIDLFGLKAANVTVRHLIFMQSGIQDYEIGDFDY